ncbi:hypothetical protein V1511DRAFT_504898 [Dipodascopsis uninucleata]
MDIDMKYKDPRKPSPRLSVPPLFRVLGLTLVTGVVMFPLGFYRGSRTAGLRFLAENSHRLPGTMQGWYFYHKRKNYVVIRDGVVEGLKLSVRFAGFVGCLFSIEATLDWIRGRIDALNTTVAAGLMGAGYAMFSHLPASQMRSTARTGLKFGLVFGLAQDMIRYMRGELWYVRSSPINRSTSEVKNKIVQVENKTEETK